MAVIMSTRACPELRRLVAGRREFVRAGMLGAAGLSLGELLRHEALAGFAARRGASVIILWMRGGPSHIDMWDPKPEAPLEYRGEFGTISTSVPGITIGELLPRCGAIMHKWSIVRSLHHHDAGHSSADQICFTGYPSGPNPDENVHPSCGSIVAQQLGGLRSDLPAYVMIPRMVPGTGPAYLGVACKPFETVADPAQSGPFQMPNFGLVSGLTLQRLASRRELAASLDRLRAAVDQSGQMEAVDRFQQQAWEILSSPAARAAFDLDSEPSEIRQRYGFMPAFDPMASNRCGAPAWSQRVLLARRLVEAGVRLVTVDLRWWDTHVKGFESLRLGFLPRFDQAYSALIDDLDARGLLSSTLVVAWGEFGRTPRVNADAGRDHYPNVFSAALAGGPIQGGRVLGESDAHGAFPKSQPKTPQDVLATIYMHLGIDVERQYLNAAGRPVPVLPSGTPLRELI
jgi:PAS domain-containing protein